MTGILSIVSALTVLVMPPVQAQTPSGTATVSGIVSDQATDAGMGRVLVKLTGTSGLGRNVITSADGSFRFDGLPAGRYTVTASKPGYLWMAYGALQSETPGPSVAVGDGESAGDIRIGLVRTSALSGTVRDEYGRGLQGLAVTAVPTGLRARQDGAERQVVTDQQGNYRVSGLPPGEYYVVARPSDAESRGATSRPEEEVDWLLAQLERGVRDDFEPWPGRQTFEAPAAYGPTYFPGTQIAAAAAPVAVGPAEQREQVDISVQRLHVANVSGVLQIPPPYDVSVAEVALVPRHEALHGVAYMAAALPPQGFRFGFDAVPPGPYVVIAKGVQQRRVEGLVQGALWAVVDVEIPASPTFDITVPLQPSGQLAGEVTAGPSAGVETRGWSVRLEPHAPWLEGSLVEQASVTSGDDGRFAMGNLGPVQYDVAITHAETRRQGWRPESAEAYGADVLDTPLVARPEVEGQMAVRVTSEDARLVGRLDVGPAFSASDFHLLIFPRDPALRSSPNRIAAVQPAGTGDYDVRGLPDGEYLVGLLVGPPGSYAVTPELLEALAGSAVAVTLQTGATVRQDISIGR